MHIVFVVPGSIDTVSGGYAYDRAMIEGLRALGHTVDVATPDSIDAAPTEATLVVDSLSIPALENRLEWLAARRAFGLIHHPTALESTSDDDVRARLHAAETAVYGRLARIIVTSSQTSERLSAEFAVAADRIAIVVPGTPDAPRSDGSGDATCAILSIGTLVPRKRHDLLLRSLSRLFDLDWHLTIVGSQERDPVHARTLAAVVEELSLGSRVTFAGEVSDAALEPLWRGADLFALVSDFEGYGMACAEALRRGIVVAVTAAGAAPTLVTPDVGVLCPVGDQVMISRSLRRLIFDTQLRKRLADGAWAAGRGLPDWPTQARAFAAALAD